MPNPYFCFKQFTIHHDRCAMKVGTDGILLGAWADIGGALRVLDIGTGSGLIALMLAQRIKAANKFAPLIDAVEVDFSAGEQATENVRNSPWSESIRVHRSTIHSYAAPCPHRYNLIISNPPFFSSKLATEDQPRSVARHTQELTPEALAEIADQLLLEEGPPVRNLSCGTGRGVDVRGKNAQPLSVPNAPCTANTRTAREAHSCRFKKSD